MGNSLHRGPCRENLEGGHLLGLLRHRWRALETERLLLYGTQEETSVHVLCEGKALVSLRHAYLHSFFLDPEVIRKLNMWAIWNFAKGTGLT